MARVGAPLVMTSGNLSGEPIAATSDDVFASLAAVADAFLVHDRPIARRVEDSVVACAPDSPAAGRARARGYAPRAIRLPVPRARADPRGRRPHEEHGRDCHWRRVPADPAPRRPRHASRRAPGSRTSRASSASSACASCGLVVHDAHPDYATTRYAEARGGRRLAVQHHHAHVLAAPAERRTPPARRRWPSTAPARVRTARPGRRDPARRGPRLTRPSALRPIPLPGGSGRSTRSARRDGALWTPSVPRRRRWPRACRRSWARAAPRSRRSTRRSRAGLGPRAWGRPRLRRARGPAPILGRATASFEGELPMRLEDLATPGARPYPFGCPDERRRGAGADARAGD